MLIKRLLMLTLAGEAAAALAADDIAEVIEIVKLFHSCVDYIN